MKFSTTQPTSPGTPTSIAQKMAELDATFSAVAASSWSVSSLSPVRKSIASVQRPAKPPSQAAPEIPTRTSSQNAVSSFVGKPATSVERRSKVLSRGPQGTSTLAPSQTAQALTTSLLLSKTSLATHLVQNAQRRHRRVKSDSDLPLLSQKYPLITPHSLFSTPSATQHPRVQLCKTESGLASALEQNQLLQNQLKVKEKLISEQGTDLKTLEKFVDELQLFVNSILMQHDDQGKTEREAVKVFTVEQFEAELKKRVEEQEKVWWGMHETSLKGLHERLGKKSCGDRRKVGRRVSELENKFRHGSNKALAGKSQSDMVEEQDEKPEVNQNEKPQLEQAEKHEVKLRANHEVNQNKTHEANRDGTHEINQSQEHEINPTLQNQSKATSSTDKKPPINPPDADTDAEDASSPINIVTTWDPSPSSSPVSKPPSTRPTYRPLNTTTAAPSQPPKKPLTPVKPPRTRSRLPAVNRKSGLPSLIPACSPKPKAAKSNFYSTLVLTPGCGGGSDKAEPAAREGGLAVSASARSIKGDAEKPVTPRGLVLNHKRSGIPTVGRRGSVRI